MTSTALAPYIDSVISQSSSSFDSCFSLIDQMLTDIAATRTAIVSNESPDDPVAPQERERIVGLTKRVSTLASSKEFTRTFYHSAIAKLSKPLEKFTVVDLEDAIRQIVSADHFDDLTYFNNEFRAIFCEEILVYLLLSGHVKVAKQFAIETNLAERFESMSEFNDLQAILDAMKAGDFNPAIRWTMTQSNMQSLLFDLHELVALNFLFNSNLSDTDRAAQTVNYTREHLSPFGAQYWQRIGSLLTATLYSHDTVSSTSTSSSSSTLNNNHISSSLISPIERIRMQRSIALEEMPRRLSNAFSNAFESRLNSNGSNSQQQSIDSIGLIDSSSSASSSSSSIPRLLRLIDCSRPVIGTLAKISRLRKINTTQIEPAAFAMPISTQYRYHTVSKEPSSIDNPPVQLASSQRNNHNGRFKCPYCPTVCQTSNCRQINF